MGLQWFAGFEAGDRNELVSYSGAVSVQSGYARSGAYGCRIMVPPSSVGFITVANGFDSTGRPATIARTTFTIGFGLRLLSLPEMSKAWEGLLYIASGTTHRASLRIGQDATLRLHVGALGSPVVASYGPVQLNRWLFCELAVLFDRWIWRMDGQIVAQGLGSPDGSMNTAYLGKRVNIASQSYIVDVDDIYTCDDATFFGPTARIVRLNPNAQGTSSMWYPPPPEDPPVEPPPVIEP